VRSSADGFGNIVTDERWFGIAIDQWAARSLADAKRAPLHECPYPNVLTTRLVS
jgi:hypothetical protein